jgi:hypothetical protein
VSITYRHATLGLQRTFVPGPSQAQGTSWTDTGWSPSDLGTYTILATVRTNGGCVQTETVTVTATNPPQSENAESGDDSAGLYHDAAIPR